MCKNILFITGAGASNPYGFPIGIKLKEEIVSEINSYKVNRPQHHLLNKYKCQEIDECLSILNSSCSITIDEVLNLIVQSKKHSIGRLLCALVACKILNKEDEDMLLSTKDWYNALFEFIVKNQQCDKLYIATFNYDRSLKHFLHKKLQESPVNFSKDKATSIVNEINILPLYFSPAYLEWENSVGPIASYASIKDSNKCISALGAYIKLHTETNIYDTENFAWLNEKLSSADIIYFLGFSFHPDNVTNLKFQNIKSTASIYATLYNADKDERKRVLEYSYKFKNNYFLNYPANKLLKVFPIGGNNNLICSFFRKLCVHFRLTTKKATRSIIKK